MTSRRHPRYRAHKILNWLAYSAHALQTVVRGLVGVTTVLAGVVLTLLPYSDTRQSPLPDWLKIVEPVMKWFHTHEIVIVLVTVVVCIMTHLASYLVSRCISYDRAKIKSLLDAIGLHAFGDQDEENHHYRVTLFKVRSENHSLLGYLLGGHWLWGAWLGVVARSGHMYISKTTVFSIDAKCDEQNTGVAGECWRCGATVIKKLPNITNSSSPTEIEEYKKSGFVDDCEYRTLQKNPTLVVATGIRINGRTWGILVLDTTDSSKRSALNAWKKPRTLQLTITALEQLVA